MEKFPNAHTLEGQPDEIPTAERGDLKTPLVTAEQMKAELAAMQEAIAEANTAEQEPAVKEQSLQEQKVQQEAADAERLQELRAELGLHDGKAVQPKEAEPESEEQPSRVPPEQPPGKADDGDGKENPDSIRFRQGQSEIKRKPCERCGGTGRRFFVFTCPVCNGFGSVVASQKMNWSEKMIQRQKTAPDATNDTGTS